MSRHCKLYCYIAELLSTRLPILQLLFMVGMVWLSYVLTSITQISIMLM